MVKYLIHCTRTINLAKIIRDKKIKTTESLDGGNGNMGETDVTYFSFFYPSPNAKIINANNLAEIHDDDRNCILIKAHDVFKKYRYYYIASNYNYGIVHDSDRISDRLYNLVQKSGDIGDLYYKILHDKQMSPQCKNTLIKTSRLKELFRFKNKPNLSPKEIFKATSSNLWEIGFFEDINFDTMSYKIAIGIDLENLVNNYQRYLK